MQKLPQNEDENNKEMEKIEKVSNRERNTETGNQNLRLVCLPKRAVMTMRLELTIRGIAEGTVPRWNICPKMESEYSD